MPELETERKPDASEAALDGVTEITAERARLELTDVMQRGAKGERFLVRWHGREQVAVVSPEDLRRLIALDSAA